MPRVYGAALEFLAKHFGGLIREIEETFSIGTTASRILDFDAERVSVVIVNLSANTVYVSPRGDVSSAKGILVTASGGAVALNLREDGILPSLEWYAVATGAASSVYVLSVKRDTALEKEEVAQ